MRIESSSPTTFLKMVLIETSSASQSHWRKFKRPRWRGGWSTHTSMAQQDTTNHPSIHLAISAATTDGIIGIVIGNQFNVGSGIESNTQRKTPFALIAWRDHRHFLSERQLHNQPYQKPAPTPSFHQQETIMGASTWKHHYDSTSVHQIRLHFCSLAGATGLVRWQISAEGTNDLEATATRIPLDGERAITINFRTLKTSEQESMTNP